MIWCCARYICCQTRRRRRTQFPDKPLGPAPYKGYQSTPTPPAYESPKFAPLDASRQPRTKDDALPPMPNWESTNQKQVLEGQYGQDVELGRLEPVHSQASPMLAAQAPTPIAGLSPTKASPYEQNPFDDPTHGPNTRDASTHPQHAPDAPPHGPNPFQPSPQAPSPYDPPMHSQNPFNSKPPHAPNPFEPLPHQGPIDAGMGGFQDNNPPSPVSRTYSPYSASIHTRYTPTPFNEPSEYRQPSPLSPMPNARPLTFNPPQPAYAAYSNLANVPHHSPSSDEPKSPYRAYSPAISANGEPQHPFAAYSPTAAMRHQSTSINAEPIELSTPYTTRPQSLASEQLLHQQEKLHLQQQLPQLQTAAPPTNLQPQQVQTSLATSPTQLSPDQPNPNPMQYQQSQQMHELPQGVNQEGQAPSQNPWRNI